MEDGDWWTVARNSGRRWSKVVQKTWYQTHVTKIERERKTEREREMAGRGRERKI